MDEEIQISAFAGMVAYLQKEHFETLNDTEIMSSLESHGDIHIAMGELTVKHLNKMRDEALVELSR